MMCAEYRQTTKQYPDMWDTPLLLHHESSSRQTSYSYGEMYRNTASVSEWEGKECVAWASSVCHRRGLDQNDVISFGTLNGRLLFEFSQQDFCNRLGNDVGRVFYEEFQDVVHRRNMRESDSHDSGDEGNLVVDLSQQHYTYEDLDSQLSQPIDLSKRCSSADENGGRDDGGDAHHHLGACCKADSEHASSGSMDEEGQSDTYLNRISTNRRRHRGPKSWEFLMRLLADERTNPSVIKWEDQSAATFRLIQPHYIAKLWGKRSGRPELTYNNFARALRYHYKKGQLVKVSERQLVYGCGPDALLFVNQLVNNERPAEETRGLGEASYSGLKR